MGGPVLSLGAGEVAMLGYGSLLLRESIAKSLGRPYVGPLHAVELDGWTRRWNVAMANRAFFGVTADGSELWPECILYLNMVRAQAGAAINGVVMVVRQEDLPSFDRRESIYDRVDVAASVRGLTMPAGTPVYAYAGQPEHLVTAYTRLPEMGLRQSYLDGVQRALAQMPESYRERFAKTTEGVPQHLVFDDQLKAGEDPFGYGRASNQTGR